jgi:hypothetical protein
LGRWIMAVNRRSEESEQAYALQPDLDGRRKRRSVRFRHLSAVLSTNLSN